MELEGAERCFHFLTLASLSIPLFVSDHHRGITNWIQSVHPNTVHYYDIWHVAKAISKKMLKASQEQGCEPIKAVRNHLYWCTTLTRPGFQELIIARWKSFMYHVVNKHEGHPSSLFPTCGTSLWSAMAYSTNGMRISRASAATSNWLLHDRRGVGKIPWD